MLGNWAEEDGAQWTSCAEGIDALFTVWLDMAVEVVRQEPTLTATFPPGVEIVGWFRDHLEQHRSAFCSVPTDAVAREAARQVGFAHIQGDVLPSWYVSLYNLIFAAYHTLESQPNTPLLPPLGVVRRRWLADMEVTLDTYAVAITRHVAALSDLALTDSLTGLLNRRGFWQRVTHSIQHGVPQAALVLLDLDHFKAVNDQGGHPAGDELLQRLASLGKTSTRSSDALARLGGDEFAWWIAGITDIESLQHRLQTLSEGLRHHQSVTFSAGIAWYPENGRNVEQLYYAADAALYRAKMAGRRCWTITGQDDIYPL